MLRKLNAEGKPSKIGENLLDTNVELFINGQHRDNQQTADIVERRGWALWKQ